MLAVPCAARPIESIGTMKRIALLLGVHAHQPVGNFDGVLSDAYERCYGPFLRLMSRYPQFPFALHVSGWLLDQWLENQPEDMNLLKAMVQRGQVEMFTAGYAEPVLAAIPEVDRVGQVERLSGDLQRKFGQRPSGSWLTERVWESSVVSSLHACGVDYVTVDDYHFLCAGQSAESLNGYYSTEEGGKRLDIFPIAEGLRYRIPFAQVHEVIEYLENLAREDRLDAAVYFDDIEKFGIWPETFEWVYEKGWLEQFIQAVLASAIIEPMTYAGYHSQQPTRGVIYLPTTSYIEMNEWTLPAPAARRFSGLVDQAKREQRYDQDRPYLRGGIWRNFMMRYPEANHLHKRMLGLSRRFHDLAPEDQTDERCRWLYLAQANDAYWHGLFGGLYLPHLRRALYRALLCLERDMDRQFPREPLMQADLNFDGYKETILQNGVLQVIVSGDGLAHIIELDLFELVHNLGDTLMRQPEHYHDKILGMEENPVSQQGINPHERVVFKPGVGPEDLVFDTLRRALFTDRVGLNGEPLRYRAQVQPNEIGMLSYACVSPSHPTLFKRISLLSQAVVVAYTQEAGATWKNFSIELNLSMPSCDGPAGRFEMGGTVLGGFGQTLDITVFEQIHLFDTVLGGRVTLGCNVPCQFRAAPCHSVSQSEAGFEKIMQSLTVTLFDFDLPDTGELLLSLAVSPTE